MNYEPEKIGILGGTFDPIHIGHLVAAVNAKAAKQLDRVLLVVSNLPWQKIPNRHITKAEQRYELVSAVCEDIDGIEASRIEIDRGGLSYTADTLEYLKKTMPDNKLFVIIGSDVACEFNSWERGERVRELAELIIVSRPGSNFDLDTLPPGLPVSVVNVPLLDISSTDLRERVAKKRPLDYLVPSAAIECIEKLGLYTKDEDS